MGYDIMINLNHYLMQSLNLVNQNMPNRLKLSQSENIIERLKLDKNSIEKLDNNDYHTIYLPKMKVELKYLDDDQEPKENKDDFIQLDCHNKNFTCNVSEKYVKVSDLKKYDAEYINKLFYEFGKEQNSKVTVVDINYWDKEKEAWCTFASAELKLKYWHPYIIPRFAKDKYPFT